MHGDLSAFSLFCDFSPKLVTMFPAQSPEDFAAEIMKAKLAFLAFSQPYYWTPIRTCLPPIPKHDIQEQEGAARLSGTDPIRKHRSAI